MAGILIPTLLLLLLLSCSVVSDSCDAMVGSPPGSHVRGILQVGILEWVVIPFSRDLPDPGIEPVSSVAPALQADCLPLSPVF